MLIISDTHIPARARDLPGQLWEAVERADVVIHAGDWVVPALLDELEDGAARLVGVFGNNDGAELRRRLPEVARLTLDGLLIFGHSHTPWDTVSPGGMRLLNPGSPTDRRRQPACTYLTALALAGGLSDVTLHGLPGRR